MATAARLGVRGGGLAAAGAEGRGEPAAAGLTPGVATPPGAVDGAGDGIHLLPAPVSEEATVGCARGSHHPDGDGGNGMLSGGESVAKPAPEGRRLGFLLRAEQGTLTSMDAFRPEGGFFGDTSSDEEGAARLSALEEENAELQKQLEARCGPLALGPPETAAGYRDAANEWLIDCPRRAQMGGGGRPFPRRFGLCGESRPVGLHGVQRRVRIEGVIRPPAARLEPMLDDLLARHGKFRAVQCCLERLKVAPA
jgi:hypothetical protein